VSNWRPHVDKITGLSVALVLVHFTEIEMTTPFMNTSSANADMCMHSEARKLALPSYCPSLRYLLFIQDGTGLAILLTLGSLLIVELLGYTRVTRVGRKQSQFISRIARVAEDEIDLRTTFFSSSRDL